jgi:hypothetical protein
MGKLYYTEILPTTPGYYWYRKGGRISEEQIVRVYRELPNSPNPQLYVMYRNGPYTSAGMIQTLQSKDGSKDLWSNGPLNPPEDALTCPAHSFTD